MKVTLIGGNGFIGSHIVDRLVQKNKYSITVFGHSSNHFISSYNNVEYIYGQFENIDLLRKTIVGSDIVIHLLSTTVPSTANMDPVYDVQSNVIGTLNLLDEVRKQNIKRFIYVSSGGTVYGNPDYTPIDERHPLRPVGSYGISKVCIENYVNLYAKKYGFSSIIVRPSNPYGPRQSFKGSQGVISTFMYKILKNETLTVWGDGNTIRDYIYIDDIVDFFINTIESEYEGVYNVGFGVGYSVNDIISTLKKVTGFTPNILNIENQSYDVKEVVLNIKNAEDIFGWRPSIDLEAGIYKYYKWFQNQLEEGKIV